jgi:ParB family chromosome partitioning protein
MPQFGLGRGLGALIQNQKDDAPDTSAYTPEPTSATPPKNEYQSGDAGEQIQKVFIDGVVPNPDQPRRIFDKEALEQLSDSIKQHGILQPLVVTPREGDNKYLIIAGERRWRAAKAAGLKTVPVIIRSSSKLLTMELALIENVQRENLGPIEEAEAYKKLMDEFNLTQEQVADKVGKSRESVANMVRLLGLPLEVQQGLADRKITAGHAKALLSISDVDKQIETYRRIVGEELTVREAEAVAKGESVGADGDADKKSKLSPQLRAGIQARKEQLEKMFSTKVDIKMNKKGKGNIVIKYFSLDEFKGIFDKLTH